MSKKQKPETQAAYIRSRLARKSAPEAILEECERRFPRGKVTLGYVNWIARRMRTKA